MADKHYKVKVEGDHIKKLASAKPILAVAELIWNAADADATRIDLEIDSDDIAMHAINVRDNGHGIPHADIENLFGKLGGSWKASANKSKSKGRILHGKEGRGRFKALALGRVAEWSIRYLQGRKLFSYTVTIIRDDLVDVRVTAPKQIDLALGTGVDVRISELDRPFRSLQADQAAQPLTEIFALFLTDYKDVKVVIDGEQLDPSKFIANREKIPLPPIIDDGTAYPCELELIEWKSSSERWLFLCSAEGFPFQRVPPRFPTPGKYFSAYLKSRYINSLQENGVLELAEMSEPLQRAQENASAAIQTHFQNQRAEEARSEVDQWKADEIYPYRTEPATAVERAERQVFEIVALNVKRHLIDFNDQTRQTKAFQLRMLRQAIERGPDELQHILTEVLDLPERTQRELSKLLEDASLSNVIASSKLVADRLKFLNGLETVLFDSETKRVLKERSQLHRIIADNNTWIFGEEFNLSVDDQSLTEVLRKHKGLLDDRTVIDEPVKRIDGKVGIVDLMLSRAVPQSRAEELEHLVVELKRPSVKIGADEITQIKKYAFSVAADERFRHVATRWSFWVISNELDSYAKAETRQKDKPRGRVYESEDGMIAVWVKSWAEVLTGCKARMKFIQDHLQANIDKESALRYLKNTYAKYLSGVVADVGGDGADETVEAESDAAR